MTTVPTRPDWLSPRVVLGGAAESHDSLMGRDHVAPRELLVGYVAPYGQPSDRRCSPDVREADGSLAVWRTVLQPGAFAASLDLIERRKVQVPFTIAHDAGYGLGTVGDFGFQLRDSLGGLRLEIDVTSFRGREVAKYLREHPECAHLSVTMDIIHSTLSGPVACRDRIVTAADLTEVSLSSDPGFGREWCRLRPHTSPV